MLNSSLNFSSNMKASEPLWDSGTFLNSPVRGAGPIGMTVFSTLASAAVAELKFGGTSGQSYQTVAECSVSLQVLSLKSYTI